MLFLQDIYCLDADGALFDAALLSAVAAFSHCKTHTERFYHSACACLWCWEWGSQWHPDTTQKFISQRMNLSPFDLWGLYMPSFLFASAYVFAYYYFLLRWIPDDVQLG